MNASKNEKLINLVKDLFATAINDGAKYWYMIQDFNKGENNNRIAFSPFCGGYLMIERIYDYGQKPAPIRVTQDFLIERFKAFVATQEFSRYIQNIVLGNYCKIEANSFLQFAILGKVIY